MPDKKYTDLANRGWNSMEAILDKEMPVKKDRRWLFVLLLLTIVGFIGSFVYLGLGRPSDQAVLEKTIDYASQSSATDDLKKFNKEGESNLNEVMLGQSDVESEASLKDKEKSRKGGSLLGNDGLESNQYRRAANGLPSIVKSKDEKGESEFEDSKRQYEKNNASIFKSNIIAANEIANTDDEEGEIEDSKARDSEAHEVVTEVVLPEELSEPRQKEIVSTLNSIQMSSALPFYTEGARYHDKMIPLPRMKRQHKRYIALYGGYSFPAASQIRGPSIGLSIGQGLSRRWALNSSLGLSFLSANSLVSFNELNNSAIGDPTGELSDPGEFLDSGIIGEEILVVKSTDGRIALNKDYYDLVTERLGNLNYLDLGLEGRYQLRRSIAATIGLRYSYLLSSNTDFIGLSEFAPSLGQKAGGLESNVLISNNLLNRNNFGLNAGFRYELNRRLSLNATFNYGLNDIIKIDNQSDTRNKLNFLGIGFDYKLYM